MSTVKSEPTDKQLVERVQQGDKSGFDLLVKKYQHKIIGLIGRYVYDHHEAMDVAQEAFIKAYRALPNFRGESAFYTWMYRIAINTDSPLLHEIETPENNLYKQELEKAVFQALERLPEDLRTALTLREFEGMSYEDIAQVMDCPVGTVRSRIFRAREALDKVISPMLY